jgi:hypothetical protein
MKMLKGCLMQFFILAKTKGVALLIIGNRLGKSYSKDRTLAKHACMKYDHAVGVLTLYRPQYLVSN